MMLAKAYQIEPRSATAAKAYAKLSYMILVGEDKSSEQPTTIWYRPQSVRPSVAWSGILWHEIIR
jgi:hypothetical protein